MNIREKMEQLPREVTSLEDICIAPIRDDNDLWFATVECRLKPGQEDFVNPAGFTIGWAWLKPEYNLPCIIWKGEERVGYICLRYWPRQEPCTDWSYYLDADQQGRGYGRKAAQIAVGMLQAAFPEVPIKLSVERDNENGKRLYESLGFCHRGEMDWDELVYELRDTEC